MKKVLRLSVLMLVIMGLMSACATTQPGTTTPTPTFTEIQYKALAASQELYKVSWGAFKQLYDTKAVNKDGKLIVDAERYAAGLKLATTYYDAWMAWINAVMAYEQNKGADGTLPVENALAICSKAAMELMVLIQPYLMEGQK